MKKFKELQGRLQEINFALSDMSTALENADFQTNFLVIPVSLYIEEALWLAHLFSRQRMNDPDFQYKITKVEQASHKYAQSKITVEW